MTDHKKKGHKQIEKGGARKPQFPKKLTPAKKKKTYGTTTEHVSAKDKKDILPQKKIESSPCSIKKTSQKVIIKKKGTRGPRSPSKEKESKATLCGGNSVRGGDPPK